MHQDTDHQRQKFGMRPTLARLTATTKAGSGEEAVDWRLVVASQATSGCALGPVLDNFHGKYGVLVYDKYQIVIGDLFRSAGWVPPLFALAALLIGGLALGLDQVFSTEKASRPGATLAATVAFSSHYYLSAILATSAEPEFVLWPLAIVIWACFDSRPSTLLASVATALAGPAIEIALTGGGGLFTEPFGHLYHYTHPDFMGISSWIAPVYFAGGTPVAMLARCYRAHFTTTRSL